MFHVQTEDSGIRSPHIFTHLFHEGVIIASKKLEYDNDADGEIVRGLMQAQHKSVMKELKSGVYDAKITAYLGQAPGAGEMQAIPLDVALDEAAATIPTISLMDEAESGPSAQSSPYAQMMVADSTAPAVVSGTLERDSSPRVEPPVAAAEAPRVALDIGDDEDINGLLNRLRDETPMPELLDDVMPQAAQVPEESSPVAIEDGKGAWLVSRPGHPERPFDRNDSVPVIVPREEVGRRVLTPPAVPVEFQPNANPSGSGSSYSQHRQRPPTNPGTQPRRPSSSQSRPAVAPRPSGSQPVQRPPAPASKSNPQVPANKSNPQVPANRSNPQVAASKSNPQVRQTASTSVPSVRPPPPPVLPRGGPPPTPMRTSAQTPVLPRAAGPASAPRSQHATPVLPRGAPASPPRGTAPVSPNARTQPMAGRRQSGESIVVARPAVVIGAPQHEPSGRHHVHAHGHGRELTPAPTPQENLFGQDLISEKSLDEVIMAYLSEDADDD